MEPVLKHVRAIMGHFKHSASATETLKGIAQSMGMPYRTLKQDVATRWSSTYSCALSLVQMRPALQVRSRHISSGFTVQTYQVISDCTVCAEVRDCFVVQHYDGRTGD